MEKAREHTAVMSPYSKATGLCLATLFALFAFIPSGAEARDRHAGYYYPRPATIETYKARARVMPKITRKKRIAFVVSMNMQILSRPYAPEYSVFVKGAAAEKMIIVANRMGRLDTLYRIRALLATLTSVARTLPIFKQFNIGEILTFFDLLRMLGFKQITVSDGERIAHQVLLK